MTVFRRRGPLARDTSYRAVSRRYDSFSEEIFLCEFALHVVFTPRKSATRNSYPLAPPHRIRKCFRWPPLVLGIQPRWLVSKKKENSHEALSNNSSRTRRPFSAKRAFSVSVEAFCVNAGISFDIFNVFEE